MSDYLIGQLAKDGKVKTDTIRFYEKIGLMPKPLHTQSGYRHYTAQNLKQIRFITRAKEMGFTLAEIKDLLAIKISTKDTCEAVYAQAQKKIKIIHQRMNELKKMKKALETLMNQCHLENHLESECPILDALDAEEETHE